ncbi:MAG: TauD/TfdA family dioxygenase [Alphaproteobacteria bacterium]
MQTGVAIARDGAAPDLYAGAVLRSACACAACRDPVSGQNLLDPAAVDPGIRPTEATLLPDGALTVRWPDGHASRYGPAWLMANGSGLDAAARRRPRPRLWDGAIQDALPRADHAEVSGDGKALYRLLAGVRDYGFAILSGVPNRDAEVERVAELFWYVRETNYGRHFDVVVKPDPNNLAYTARALPGHTDNPYAEPVPGLQLLHCLAQSDDGGDNTLADGFHAADRLRHTDPAAFATLARVPVAFRFADATTDLRSRRTILDLDAEGTVRAVHVNDRAFIGPDAAPPEAQAFYGAYRTFIALVRDPAAEVRIKLRPGDVLIMDNRRTLHGRRAYQAGRGHRHLQGCYVDGGGLASKLRVLARAIGHDTADAGLPGADRESEAVDRLFAILDRRGDEAYLGEPITQLQHALQTARAAELGGASPALIAAALLHDIGHFLHDLPDDCAERGIDSRHEDVGGAYLSRLFRPEVSEPVRLHVDAKRYLAAVEPWYHGRLSDASKRSLEVQGGPFAPAEADGFARRPHANDAIRLRRWDEAGKDPAAAVPGLDHYRPVVMGLLGPDA